MLLRLVVEVPNHNPEISTGPSLGPLTHAGFWSKSSAEIQMMDKRRKTVKKVAKANAVVD